MQRAPVLDGAPAFLRYGYLFGTRTFQHLETDAFRTRLAGRPVVVMKGADAARFFYEGGRFERTGAMPTSVSHLLQDEGSVQSLEGVAHRTRKEMFLGLLADEGEDALVAQFRSELQRAIESTTGESVRLIDLFTAVLTRAVCVWAGLPQAVCEELERSRALPLMIERAGTFGPANWTARLKRRAAENLLAQTVSAVRANEADAPAGSALAVIADYREPNPVNRGAPEMLDPEIAAVELLNLLRPVVAVGRFMVFAALALHRYPTWRARFASGDDVGLRPFVNEVRRFYPFFPVIAGRATRALEWQDHTFTTGDRAILDLYATTHDRQIWGDPERFRPSRFSGIEIDPNTLIPQGGGHYRDDHRCPGEPSTIALLEASVLALSRSLDYRVPDQDLRVSLRHFPALPESGFIAAGMTWRGGGD